jgi:FlaA1/EpsC-like NDP-sugar epimerase
VVGGRADLAKVAADYSASAVLIAIPSAPAELIREVTDSGRAAGLDVKILPSLREIFDGTARVGALRSPTIADLLGRREVRAQLAAAAGYLSGKRVLITGAGGSIGSELSRQIARLSPAELIVVDRDESALHALQMSISGRALLDSPDVVVVDIRDRRAVRDLFEDRRPQVVFHAAALKHLPALEMYPGEAIKTNVWATMHVLEAAATSGVERFVNVSTDKAANPTSALGYSKRIGERLTAAVAQQVAGTYVSVRFGNVLGSRGSVLGAFQDQIAKGGPVTVTHPEVSRYFMTVEEACGLVIQAGAIGRPGQALVLDMGAPVRIADVARRLIAEAGKPVDIVYTGLRPGEKLHENLFGDGEPDERPLHPLVSHVTVPPLHPGRLRSLDAYSTPAEMIEAMAHLASAPGIRAGESGCIDLRSVTADPAWTHALVTAQGHDPLPLEADPPAGCRRHRRQSDPCGHGVPACDSDELSLDLLR